MQALRNATLCCGLLLSLWIAPVCFSQNTGPGEPQARPAKVDEPVRAPDAAFSLELVYLPLRSAPVIRGSQAAGRAASELAIPRKVRPAAGLIMSIPAIRNNHLRFSYFQMTGSADTIANSELALFSKGFSPGDFLTTGYKLQTGKISLDYLSYPFPPEGSPLRLKTLWEIQITGFRSSIDAPLKPETAAATSGRAVGTLWLGYPTFGLGIEHYRSQQFHWEAKFSGFGVPGHAATWDAEAKMAFRRGRWEGQVGLKSFYFRTSPKQEEYVRATLSGLYLGLRWRPGQR
jgi:hypothetical protein